METDFEKTLNEYLRRGDIEKAKILQTLDKRVMGSQIQRILRNDKTVLKEMVLPSWLNWELLKAWAEQSTAAQAGSLCALCSSLKETGISFHDKFICEQCYREMKTIPDRVTLE